MKKQKILITGGTGFIGFNILKKLQNLNYNLYSLSTNKPNKYRKIKKVKYLNFDLKEKKKIKKYLNLKFDYIINLAGYVDHKNKAETMSSHYNGCKNLVDFFADKKIKNFIQIGSSLEYGKLKAPNLEKNFCRPISNYGLAKYKASNYLIKKGKKNKLPFTILRLYQIYGPHQTINRLIPVSIKACLENKIFACSDGKQRRDFLYIDDLSRLIILVLKKKPFNTIFNVGSGKPIKIKKVVQLIKYKISLGNPIFGKKKMRKDEVLNCYPNIKKIKNSFGWKPRVNFKDGINATINFYKSKKLGIFKYHN